VASISVHLCFGFFLLFIVTIFSALFLAKTVFLFFLAIGARFL